MSPTFLNSYVYGTGIDIVETNQDLYDTRKVIVKFFLSYEGCHLKILNFKKKNSDFLLDVV